MFGLINESDLRKWVRFIFSCAIAAFVSFWGAFATVGGTLLYAGSTPALAYAGGIFAGAGAMAAAVLATAHGNEMWKELTVILPKQPPADPTSPPATTAPSPTDWASRPPAITG